MRIEYPPHSTKGRGATLDLKVRLPPHMMMAKAVAEAPPAIVLAPQGPVESKRHTHPHRILALGCIAILLLPVMCIEESWAAVAYLCVSPLCAHVVLLYYHRNPTVPARHHHIHIATSMVAFAIGGVSAIITASAQAEDYHAFAFPCMSAALCIGACDFIFILPKGVVARVISCTACGVLIVVLACLSLVSPPLIAHQCYKSTCIPLLYLSWQSQPNAEAVRAQDEGAIDVV